MDFKKTIDKQAQAVQAYMKGRLKYFAELNYSIKPSEALLEHSAKNARNAYEALSVASSQTSMEPCHEAIAAAKKGGKHFHEQTNDTIIALQRQLRQLQEDGDDLAHKYREYVQVHSSTDILGYTPPEKALKTLDKILAKTPKEYRDYICASWEDLDPAIAEYMEHLGEPGYVMQSKLPASQKEKGAFNNKIFKFCAHAIEIIVEGFTGKDGHEKPSLINPPINALSEQIAAERRKLEAEATTRHVVNDSLKPQVMRNLRNLHGIDVQNLDNISTCHGTNTTIVTAAIAGLIKEEPGKQKLLLQFAMSWDAYKSYDESKNLRHHFLNGAVSGQTLEEFIQKVLFEGRAHSPEHAKRVVSANIGGLLISVPENPLGNNLSPQERKELIDIIVKYDIRPIILDEIYAVPGCKSLSTEPGMEDRCYVVAGTSKYMSHDDKMSFGYSNNTEYAKAVEAVIPERTQLTPKQAAIFAAFLENTPLSYHQECEAKHKAKAELITQTMERVNTELGIENAVSWLKAPQSGRLGVICVSPKLAQQCGIKNSTQFAEYLYKTGGVEGLPLGDAEASATSPKGIRVNFSKPDDFLVAMVERVGIAAQHMKEKVQYSDIEGKGRRGENMHGGFQQMTPFGGSFVMSGTGPMPDFGTIAQMLAEMHGKMMGGKH